jgi:hypothetical protein
MTFHAIAIDGPAASGKSTLARSLAERLGLVMVNSGAMYRAVTWKVLRKEIDPADTDAVGVIGFRKIARHDDGPGRARVEDRFAIDTVGIEVASIGFGARISGADAPGLGEGISRDQGQSRQNRGG